MCTLGVYRVGTEHKQVMGKVSPIGQRAPRAEWVARLVQKYDSALRAFLYRLLRSEADAEDVAQESYLKLYRLARPDEASYPRALLFRTATNLAITRLAARERDKLVAMDPLDLDALGNQQWSAETAAMYTEAVDELNLTIKSLTPRTRQVLVMHKFLGMTNQEIADELGITHSTVEQHVTRALAQCRQRMSKLDCILVPKR